jgi:hypothetical protein
MAKLNGSLLVLYLMAAAGYGGWRGGDVWSGWGIWCLLLPPLAWAALKAVGEWLRNPYWVFIKIGLAMSAATVLTIGGPAVVLAVLVAEVTERWSPEPERRALAGVGLVAVAVALQLATGTFGKLDRPQNSHGPVNTGGAEPAAPPDRS